MSDIGPQRATPKSLSAIKAEMSQKDSYIMPKPEEIIVYKETGVCLNKFYDQKIDIVIGPGVLDARRAVL